MANMLKFQYFLAVLVLTLCISVVMLAAPALCESNAPVVGIVAPPNGATLNGNQVEITAGFVSDEDHPVAKLRVFLDGQTVTERIFETPSVRGNSSFRWDTTRTPNGRHQIDVQAFSSNGDYLGMSTCVVMVLNKPADFVAPKVAVTNPKEGEIVSGVKTISISASDDSGIDPLVSVFVDSSLKSVSNTKPYTYDWDTTKLDNGPHVITAKAADEADNQAGTKPVKVIVRNSTGPQISAQSAAKPVITISVADASKPAVSGQQAASNATPAEKTAAKVNESARVTPPQTTTEASGMVPTGKSPKPAAAASQVAAVPQLIPARPAAVKLSPAPSKPVTIAVQAPKPATMAKASPAPVTEVAAPMAKIIVKEPSIAKPVTVAAQTPTPKSATTIQSAPKPIAVAKAPVMVKQPIVAKAAPLIAGPAQATKPTVIARVAAPAKPVMMAKAQVAPKPNVVMVKVPLEPVVEEPASAKAQVAGDKTYMVQSGDSVSRIASIFGVPANSIVALNNIEDPSALKVGEKIALPETAKMVRMRMVVEEVGGTIEWNSKTRTARAVCAQSEIKVKIGSRTATINNQKVTMERRANIHAGRTIVPKSFMLETLSR